MESNFAEVAAYIARLVPSVGGCRNAIDERNLRTHFQRCEFSDMVSEIKKHFCLPVKLRIGRVNNGGPGLAVAWVEIPNLLPMYGSWEFRQMMFTLYVKNLFLAEASFAAVCNTFAHELSHLVIEGIRHPLKREERAVDLLAMILGFADISARSAMDTSLSNDPHGYLTPEERVFARDMIAYMR